MSKIKTGSCTKRFAVDAIVEVLEGSRHQLVPHLFTAIKGLLKLITEGHQLIYASLNCRRYDGNWHRSNLAEGKADVGSPDHFRDQQFFLEGGQVFEDETGRYQLVGNWERCAQNIADSELALLVVESLEGGTPMTSR